jgi:hypothetical protein
MDEKEEEAKEKAEVTGLVAKGLLATPSDKDLG